MVFLDFRARLTGEVVLASSLHCFGNVRHMAHLIGIIRK
jgi:hypothetical protein